ncbi:MAG: hypothetical protein ACLSCO_04495 [Gallintestinimicrobium sp.]
MNPLERFSRACIVPVVVLDNAEDAVPTAKRFLPVALTLWKSLFEQLLQKTALLLLHPPARICWWELAQS